MMSAAAEPIVGARYFRLLEFMRARLNANVLEIYGMLASRRMSHALRGCVPD